MARFLHTADLHLGSAGDALPEEIARQREREITSSLPKIVDLALERDVDLLLVAGDLFTDKFTTPALLRYVNYQFGRLGNKHVLVCAGNHDPLLQDAPAAAFPWQKNVHFFLPHSWQQLAFHKLGIAVAGISWGELPPQPELLTQIPASNPGFVNIALLHGSAGKAAQLAAEYFPLPEESLIASGYQYFALGHYHNPSSWEAEGTLFAYPGSPEPLSFGEEGRHGVWLGETSAGQVSISFIPLGKREYVTLRRDVTGMKSEAELVEELKKDLKARREDLVGLTLTGSLPRGFKLDLDFLKENLEELVFYLRLQDATWEEVDLTDFPQGSLRQLFSQRLAEELANTQDPYRRKTLELALRYGLEALARGTVDLGGEA